MFEMHVNASVQLISEFSLSDEDTHIMILEIDFLRHVYAPVGDKLDTQVLPDVLLQQTQTQINKIETCSDNKNRKKY